MDTDSGRVATADVSARVTRRWLAGASLAVPVIAIVLTWFAWRAELPERVAFHWSASGRPDGTFPTDALFWMMLGMTVACLLLAILALLVPSSRPGESGKSLMILGTVSAFAAAAWLAPAGATYTTASEPGGWLVLFVIALLYGQVPRMLTPAED